MYRENEEAVRMASCQPVCTAADNGSCAENYAANKGKAPFPMGLFQNSTCYASEIPHGIHRRPIHIHFKVTVRTCGIAGRAGIGDNRAFGYGLAFGYSQRLVVSIQCGDTAAMIDNDSISVTGNPSGIHHHAAVCCMNRRTIVYADINACMEMVVPKIG